MSSIIVPSFGEFPTHIFCSLSFHHFPFFKTLFSFDASIGASGPFAIVQHRRHYGLQCLFAVDNLLCKEEKGEKIENDGRRAEADRENSKGQRFTKAKGRTEGIENERSE